MMILWYLVGFSAYVCFSALEKRMSLTTYISENKRLLTISVACVVALVLLPKVIMSVLLAPTIIAMVASYLSGSLAAKLVGIYDTVKDWIIGLTKKVGDD